MGRPRKYSTEKERKQAKKESNKKYMKKPGVKEKTAKTRKIRLAKPVVRERERARYSDYNRQYALKHKKIINEKQNKRRRDNLDKYSKKRSKSRKLHDSKIKERLFKILGGSECALCGFSNKLALDIGHIYDTGNLDKERFSDVRQERKYYCEHPFEARKNLQIQCSNCNQIQLFESRKEKWHKNKHTPQSISSKKRRNELKSKLFEILGGKKCVICKEFTDERALQFGHIDDGGNLDRKKLSSSKFYVFYVNNPDDAIKLLQVECSNCNNIKSRIKSDKRLSMK